MSYQILKNHFGFTIIELLVAISIFLGGILAIYAIVQQPLYYTSFFMSKFTAFYLAQEGIEETRNIRDSNWINRRTWDTGLLPDSSTDWMQFTRNIQIRCLISGAPLPCPDEPKKVVVTVQWDERGKSEHITVQENLYNWFGQ